MNPKRIMKAIDGRSAAKILKDEANFRMTKSEDSDYFTLSFHIDLKEADPYIKSLIHTAFGSGSYEKFSHTSDGKPLDEFEIKSKYSINLNDKDAKQAAANGFANLVCKKLSNEIKNVSMAVETERRNKFSIPTIDTKPKGNALTAIFRKLATPGNTGPALSH
ncbi:hypothetical protein [Vibrio owensii]|uniref:hypothetical protein n=1 Tax=Vibrio harveyi group TaxID=717610 RepID=UPI003CC634C6